jgi:hypothetical protein
MMRADSDKPQDHQESFLNSPSTALKPFDTFQDSNTIISSAFTTQLPSTLRKEQAENQAI